MDFKMLWVPAYSKVLWEPWSPGRMKKYKLSGNFFFAETLYLKVKKLIQTDVSIRNVKL